MNRRQIEVQQIQASNEQQVLRQLKQVYIQASKDCAAKIRDLSSRTDMENLQSIIYQKRYQEVLKKQIDLAVNQLTDKSFNTISDYLNTSYESGFFGALYDLQGQGIPLCFPIDQNQAIAAVQIDSKISKSLYSKIGEDVNSLKKTIRVELSRGISIGESWNMVAARIAMGMSSPFNKAYNNAARIAKTEGHRVQQEATFHCQQKAKSKGADVVKQWDSTLDGVTRPSHRALDGQIREVDDSFQVNGKTAMYPGAFGEPAEDCNCRCCLLQRARWALSEEEYYTKWDGDKNELVTIKAKGYNEFKKQAQERLLRMQFPDDVYKIKGLTSEVKEELEIALLKLKSEYDIRLNSISVEKAERHDIFITGYHDGKMYMVINEDADFGRVFENMKKRHESNYYAGKSLEDYIAHEMAHVMLYQDCTSDSIYHAKYQQVESLYDSLKGISKYADRSKSGNETLAEAFVRVRNGEVVAPIVKLLVESYFGRWRK